MPIVFICSICNQERDFADRRTIAVSKEDGEKDIPAQKPVDACVHCLSEGIVLTNEGVKKG